MFTIKVITLKLVALAVYVLLMVKFPTPMRILQKESEIVSGNLLDQIPDSYAVIMAHSGVQHIFAYIAIVVMLAICGTLLRRLFWG